VVNVDGAGLHQLNAGGCVKPCAGMGVEGNPWSPDGKQIVYERAVNDASGKCCVEVAWWVMQADGSGARRLWVTSDATDDHYVEWSPDGKHFVFTRIDQTTSPVRSALFTMATDGSALKQITPWELNAADQALSPDGTLIVFQSPTEPNQGSVQNIYTIHPDGTGLIQLTKYTSADASSQGTFGADWSPDGSQIVFCHFPSEGGGDLFVMNRDGSGLHLLAHTDFFDSNPDWGASPAP
jgi:dipeptidyl aminopeptidase/acylaminoacyl peptidase